MKAILVLDWYCVFMYENVARFIEDLCKERKFTPEIKTQLWLLALDKQNYRIEWPEFGERFESIAGFNFEHDYWANEVWSKYTIYFPQMVEFVRLQRSISRKVYFITNIHQTCFEKRKTEKPFSLFNGGIASSEVGIRKPRLEIYELLCGTYRLEKSHILFVDDLLENVEAARSTGMNAVQFHSHFNEVAMIQHQLDVLDAKIGTFST